MEGNAQPSVGSFGDALRRYRIEAGLTQAELAERAGLSVRGISDLERGVRQAPYRDNVRRLAEALQLSTAERSRLEALRRPARAAMPARHQVPEPTSEGPSARQPAIPRLPVPLTSFIGREADVSRLQQLLTTHRLVTLVGTGGVGKTRLALEVARARVVDFVTFVDLAPVSDARLVGAAIATTLGVRERSDVPVLDLLATTLLTGSHLVVLDNCEHVIQECAGLADHLLRECPRLQILATSREPLYVPGEQVWSVLPLALPPPGDSVLAGVSEAVLLFVDRARLVQPGFALDEVRAPLVVQVCRMLDGLPLALELATSRLPLLGLERLAARLHDRFHVLTQGSRVAPARQQTLRAVVDWSHDLLSKPERMLLRRLAVFAGGWNLEMAEQICAGDGLHQASILDLLARLVDKSLVLVTDDGSEPRYGFLETLRQYAAERLRESEERERVARRHLDWFVELAERADSAKDGPRRAAWLRCLEREHGNFRAALAWSLAASKAPEAALRLAGALGWFWWLGGHASEGSRWLGQALTQTPTDEAPASVARARAWALAEAGRLRLRQADRVTARELLSEGLIVARQVGNHAAEASALLYLGELALDENNARAARSYLAAGFALAQKVPGGPAACRFLHWLGHAAEADGNPGEAASMYAQARVAANTSGDAFFEAVAVRGLASAAIERGELDAASALLLEAVALSRNVENATIDYPALLAHFARLAVAKGQSERALRLGAAVAALENAAGTYLFRYDRELLARSLDSARCLLTSEVAVAASKSGQAMDRNEALAYAASHEQADLGVQDGAPPLQS